MKIINKIIFSFTILTISLSPLLGKEDFRIENQTLAIEQAFSVSNTGILKQKENGFVYLDISDDFITSIIPLLDHEGALRPRPTASRSIGAHISVFVEKEEIVPVELGSSFSFEVKDIRSFTLHTRDGLKKLWVIAVESPELEELRSSYGLSPKLKGYDFHISLAKQMPSAPEDWENIETLSPFNFSGEETSGLNTQGDFIVVENEQLIATAEKVNAIGQLKLKGNGFVYLDVSNEYIDDIAPNLPLNGEFSAVSTKPKKMGAHISVIYEDEMIGNEIWTLNEAGEWFTFEVKQLRFINRGEKRLWILAVDAPSLERLRKSYNLKPKLKGHDFHITLGNENTASEIKEAA